MALKPQQLQLIEAMLASPMASDVQLAKMLHINNKTVGVWRKLPEFQDELKRRLADKWKDAERIAQETMINLASEGDFKASKFILESMGYAPTQHIEAEIKNDINIVIGE